MINFRIMLDISSIYIDIKQFKLKKYNSPFPTIFISAKDPDQACHFVISELIDLVMKQDSSIASRLLCRKIRKLAKIDKVYILT